jgi:hypothetical protein
MFSVTILALLYLASVNGVNLHLHYCMGEVVSWQLLGEKPSPKKCVKCGMTNTKGCCEDQSRFVKVDTLKAPVAVLDNSNYNYNLTYNYNIPRPFRSNYAPPDKQDVPVYLYDCVFRI